MLRMRAERKRRGERRLKSSRVLCLRFRGTPGWEGKKRKCGLHEDSRGSVSTAAGN